MSAHLAAPDALTLQSPLFHLGVHVLPEIAHRDPRRDVLRRQCPKYAVQSDPRMNGRLHRDNHLHQFLQRIRNVLSLIVPRLDQREIHRLTRIHLPLIALHQLVHQHALKHRPVHFHRRSRQIRHQMDIDLIARILEQPHRTNTVTVLAASIDVRQHRIVSVLHSNLQPRRPILSKLEDRPEITNRIGSRLQCDADDPAL